MIKYTYLLCDEIYSVSDKKTHECKKYFLILIFYWIIFSGYHINSG